MVGFMDAALLPLSLSPSLQKHRSGVTGQGRGAPLLIGLFSRSREVKGRRRDEDNGVPLPLQNKRDALPEKDRPVRAHIDLRDSPQTTPKLTE